MNTIQIRPAVPDDAEILAPLAHETFRTTHLGANPQEILDAYMDRAFAIEKVRTELEDPANVFHLAFEGVRAIGYSKILYDSPCLLPSGPGRLTKLERIYLLASEHGKKAGIELLLFNRRLAEAREQDGMWLTVWPGNVRAIRFYERVGFRKIGDVFFQLTPQIRNPNDLMLWRFR